MKSITLKIPPAAVTQTSIAVIWDRDHDIAKYEIYVNERLYDAVKRGDCTIEGLEPGTEYEIHVNGIDSSGSFAAESDIITALTRPDGGIYNVCDYGAKGDGKTRNTRAIQRAIDECAENGVVVIPAGTFISGAIYLKSDMSLRLDEGAVLLGSENPDDYPIKRYRWEGREHDCYSSLINVKFDSEKRFKNITIEGKGKIDASGVALFLAERAENKAQRGRAVCIRNTDGVYYKDITVKQSPSWCVHTIYSNGVTANNIKVYTCYDEDRDKRYGHIFNGDGFDPDSCKDVYIFNSMIASQDDCIAIKSGRDEEGRKVGIPSENIRITDCRFENGFGVAIGSETSGGVRNVLVRDCEFTHVYSIGSVKSPRGRGNVIENILYENCIGEYQDTEHKDCEWFRGGIYVDNFYSVIQFDSSAEEPVTDATPKIRNVTFRNIRMKSSVSNAVYLAGLPESPLEDITLLNVTAEGPKGMKAFNIRGLTMKNVEIITNDPEMYHYENVVMND
ncbi:MAG: glycoside hydrolase family 28 protein [Oscillospiraceae bacterium]|nr:glycoside hydrolase family 28 protein [Oscillospiraceae bacterium]